MKYKDFEPTKADDRARWYVMDEEYGEFANCDKCRAEVPIEKFSDWMTTKWLCWMCSNSTETDEQTKQHANFAANMVLLAFGAFDDVEIEEWQDDDVT